MQCTYEYTWGMMASQYFLIANIIISIQVNVHILSTYATYIIQYAYNFELRLACVLDRIFDLFYKLVAHSVIDKGLKYPNTIEFYRFFYKMSNRKQ